LNSNPPSVIVVGAGAGGDATAIGLRKQGFEGTVTLIGRESERPYERPQLSKQFLAATSNLERVFLHPEGEYERLGIEYLAEQTAVGGSLNDHCLRLDSGRTIPFDRLVLATGSTPRMLPDVPRAANILTLRSLQDAIVVKEQLEDANRILIVGAGFIGAEVASSARTLGKDVILVELAETPLERVLGRDVGQVYALMHRDHGVDLRLGTSVTHWATNNGLLTGVDFSDGSAVNVDLALIAVGATPNVDLAAELGLDVGPNGVRVDETLQAAPGIYAIGDIAAHRHPVFGRRIRVEHWQVAQRQGTSVAASIAGEPTPYTELPWFWSDQYGINLQYVGHAAGFDTSITRGNLEAESFSVFYLSDDVLDATLSVNDGRSGRFSRDLISNRISIPEEALATMVDPSTDLRELVRNLGVKT